MVKLRQNFVSSREPKLLNEIIFIFTLDELKRFNSFRSWVKETLFCLSAHLYLGEVLAIGCAWSLEIQKVKSLLAVKALVHLLYFLVLGCGLFLLLFSTFFVLLGFLHNVLNK